MIATFRLLERRSEKCDTRYSDIAENMEMRNETVEYVKYVAMSWTVWAVMVWGGLKMIEWAMGH